MKVNFRARKFLLEIIHRLFIQLKIRKKSAPRISTAILHYSFFIIHYSFFKSRPLRISS